MKLFDEIPHLEGERLVLRKITEKDGEALQEMAHSIEIITASTMVDNKASAHVLEKNGFMTTSSINREDWGHAESTDAYRWFL